MAANKFTRLNRLRLKLGIDRHAMGSSPKSACDGPDSTAVSAARKPMARPISRHTLEKLRSVKPRYK